MHEHLWGPAPVSAASPSFQDKMKKKEMSEGRQAAAQSTLELKTLKWSQVFQVRRMPALIMPAP